MVRSTSFPLTPSFLLTPLNTSILSHQSCYDLSILFTAKTFSLHFPSPAFVLYHPTQPTTFSLPPQHTTAILPSTVPQARLILRLLFTTIMSDFQTIDSYIPSPNASTNVFQHLEKISPIILSNHNHLCYLPYDFNECMSMLSMGQPLAVASNSRDSGVACGSPQKRPHLRKNSPLLDNLSTKFSYFLLFYASTTLTFQSVRKKFLAAYTLNWPYIGDLAPQVLALQGF